MAEESKLTVIVPSQLHQRIIARAKADGQTVAAYIRSCVLSDLKSEALQTKKKDTAK